MSFKKYKEGYVTKKNAEEARKKFWQIIGDKINQKALNYGKGEVDVYSDIRYLVSLLHKTGCSIPNIAPPPYLNYGDLRDIRKKISMDDLEKLSKLVIELQGQG